jgi:uncharacterized protein (DUF2461 family)
MEADGGFAVAGLYHPQTDRLEALREGILENAEKFAEILEKLSIAGLTLDKSEATKNMPRAFTTYADHPLADVIKLKNMLVRIEIPKESWIAADLVSEIVKFARAATPLLEYLTEATS